MTSEQRETVAPQPPAAIPPPVPLPDPDTAGFWTATSTGQLAIARCQACRRWQHPPLELCRHCAGPIAFEEVAGTGTVFSFITVRQPTVPGREGPYVVGLVELDESPDIRLSGIVRGDVDTVSVGDSVRCELVAVPGTDLRAPEFIRS